MCLYDLGAVHRIQDFGDSRSVVNGNRQYRVRATGYRGGMMTYRCRSAGGAFVAKSPLLNTNTE